MGLFGAIKGIGKSIFGGGGGGGSGGYVSPYTRSYENQNQSALSNMLGGVSKDKNGNYNFGEGFKNLSGSAGKDYATQGYDFSPMDTAIESYKTSSYKPTAYSFGDENKIDEMTDLQYGLGSKNINRAGNNSLTKIQEATGTRRPGLLMKAAETNQRGVNEDLASLNSNLRATALGQKTQLNKEQQLAQEEQAKYGAEDSLRRNQAMAEAAQNKISTESGLTENERNHQKQMMDYLQDLFYKTGGMAGQAAATRESGRGNTLDFLGTIGSSGVGRVATSILRKL